MDYLSQYNLYLNAINKYLDGLFVSDSSYHKIYESIRYSLLSSGKRIRPVLTLEFARLGNTAWPKALPYACALEMVHTYSLIHDDLPCMDNDDLRRGKPTNHKVYGECLAVLAGDALQPEAYSLIANSNFSAENKVKAIQILTSASGVDGMISGQVLDTVYDIDDYDGLIDLNYRKTGRMIIAAAELGCLVGEMNQENTNHCIHYAQNIGLAFQIEDDILDVVGNEEIFGKPIGSDKNVGKKTFVNLIGIDKCRNYIQDLTTEAINEVKNIPDHDFLITLANSLINRKK